MDQSTTRQLKDRDFFHNVLDQTGLAWCLVVQRKNYVVIQKGVGSKAVWCIKFCYGFRSPSFKLRLLNCSGNFNRVIESYRPLFIKNPIQCCRPNPDRCAQLIKKTTFNGKILKNGWNR